RIILDRLEDAVEVVGDGRQKAGRELRAQRAGVEQRRRRGHEVERREQVVERDRLLLAVDLAKRQTAGDAHEERLRQLEAHASYVQEVAVIESLESEVVESQIAFGLQRRREPVEVETT